MAGRTLLLDSDIIAFKIAASNQLDTAFGSDVGDFDIAAKECDAYIKQLKKQLGAQDVVVCLSCREHNWRYDVLPSYKQNRDHSIRPEHLDPLKHYMAENYRTYLRYGLEADDVMGILATSDKIVSGETIIVSEDKDMRVIPTLVYHPHRPENKIMEITPLEARQFHMWQTLTGDPTDGYKGAPGIGKGNFEFATAVLEEDMDELWDTVLAGYGSKGLTEEDALKQARCAHILTAGWYDFTEKEVKLFEPDFIDHF